MRAYTTLVFRDAEFWHFTLKETTNGTNNHNLGCPVKSFAKKWTMPIRYWKEAMSRFVIEFDVGLSFSPVADLPQDFLRRSFRHKIIAYSY